MKKPEQKFFKNNISIVIAGEAGAGLNTIETILVYILKNSLYNVYSTKEYMSRIRGGTNSTTIRVSTEKLRGNIKNIDLFVPMNENSLLHMKDRITDDTIIISDENITEINNSIKIPFLKIANESGLASYSGMVIAGFILGLFKIDKNIITDFLKNYFLKKPEEVIEKNIFSILKGYDESPKYSEKIKIKIEKNTQVKNSYLLNGVEGTGYGALSAGCNFISSYPMSPSTGLLTFLSKKSKEFEIIVEQAEDEIAAINMACGAWYAGAKAIISTSGGGFALMSEGLSLAGIIESPLVIHLAQRPGPATGLPTRTEQGDLELVLYAGHGDFPRIILAPGNIEEALILTNKAFYLADKFQLPVFILTDQYFVDTYYTVDEVKFEELKNDSFIIESDENYKRFAFTKNGISPRALPGHGEGFVRVDSDEHDETGRITESPDLRVKMVDKRLKKFEEIKKEIIEPKFYGNNNYKTVVVSWGSTYETVKEALLAVNNKETAHLHFSQVYPVSAGVNNILNKADKIIIIENNVTGQLSKILKLETGIDITNKILKYDGYHFFVEELAEKIKSFI